MRELFYETLLGNPCTLAVNNACSGEFIAPKRKWVEKLLDDVWATLAAGKTPFLVAAKCDSFLTILFWEFGRTVKASTGALGPLKVLLVSHELLRKGPAEMLLYAAVGSGRETLEAAAGWEGKAAWTPLATFQGAQSSQRALQRLLASYGKLLLLKCDLHASNPDLNTAFGRSNHALAPGDLAEALHAAAQMLNLLSETMALLRLVRDSDNSGEPLHVAVAAAALGEATLLLGGLHSMLEALAPWGEPAAADRVRYLGLHAELAVLVAQCVTAPVANVLAASGERLPQMHSDPASLVARAEAAQAAQARKQQERYDQLGLATVEPFFFDGSASSGAGTLPRGAQPPNSLTRAQPAEGETSSGELAPGLRDLLTRRLSGKLKLANNRFDVLPLQQLEMLTAQPTQPPVAIAIQPASPLGAKLLAGLNPIFAPPPPPSMAAARQPAAAMPRPPPMPQPMQAPPLFINAAEHNLDDLLGVISLQPTAVEMAAPAKPTPPPAAQPPPPPPPKPVGARRAVGGSPRCIIPFPHLKLGRELGSGGYGKVVAARFLSTDVAVKQVTTLSEQARKEFVDEANLLQDLRHQHVIQFMGVALDDTSLYIVMELASNGTLWHLLHGRPELCTPARRLQWAREAALGVEYLHGQTPMVVHRDLKSVNLLLCEDNHVKVSDFGLSKRLERGALPRSHVGTPAWKAPEMIDSLSYDEKVDVYSFGIVMWELLSCREPFRELRAVSPWLIYRAVVQERQRPPLPTSASVPPRSPLYVPLMQECWDQDPLLRPSFTAIVARLRAMSPT